MSEAILHCAAVSAKFHLRHTAQSARDIIRSWHMAKGWKDIGYHYVVMPNGDWIAGRPLEQVGAHTIGRNIGTLGVLMVERKEIDRLRTFEAYFTGHQKQVVRGLLYEHGIRVVTGHNDWAAKLCPGFKVNSDEWV